MQVSKYRIRFKSGDTFITDNYETYFDMSNSKTIKFKVLWGDGPNIMEISAPVDRIESIGRIGKDTNASN